MWKKFLFACVGLLGSTILTPSVANAQPGTVSIVRPITNQNIVQNTVFVAQVTFGNTYWNGNQNPGFYCLFTAYRKGDNAIGAQGQAQLGNIPPGGGVPPDIFLNLTAGTQNPAAAYWLWAEIYDPNNNLVDFDLVQINIGP